MDRRRTKSGCEAYGFGDGGSSALGAFDLTLILGQVYPFLALLLAAAWIFEDIKSLPDWFWASPLRYNHSSFLCSSGR
jgi:hypothetical protein